MIFSLIVPTIHRTVELDRLLSSLVSQKTDGWDLSKDLEVLIVDQNPDDRLEKVIAPYRDRLTLVHFKAPPLGQSHAKNLGLQKIRGRFVGFPDDDCYMPQDALEQVKRAFGVGRDAFGLFGRAFDPETQKFLLKYPFRPQVIRGLKNSDSFLGVQIAQFYPSVLAQKVGGFDPDLCSGGKWGSGEETDFALKFLGLGYDIHFEPDILIYHPLVVAQTMDLEKVRRYSRGFGALCRKHGLGFHWFGKVLKQFFGAFLLMVGMNFKMAKVSWVIALARWDGYWAYGIENQTRKR